MRRTVQSQSAADDGRVAGKAALPETFAEDDNVAAVRSILVRIERTTGNNRCAEQPKEVGAHLCGRELLWIADAGEIDHTRSKGRHVLKRAGLLPPEVEPRRRRSW